MKTSSLTQKERYAYGLAGLGQNMIYNFTTSYIMIFYTDVAGIGPAAVGTLLLIARFFDAVNDPILGFFLDRKSSKNGKLIPILKNLPIPMAVFTILIFWVPSMHPMIKIVYAYLSYLLWDVVYTLSDVPYWGLSVAISPDADERFGLVRLARILCNVGLAVSIVIPPLIISSFGGQQKAYLIAALSMALIGSALFSLVGRYTKERIEYQVPKEPVNFRVWFENRPLLILQSSRLLQAFRMVIASAGLYFAKYNLGDEAYFSLLGGLLIGAMLLAMFVTPLLSKRLNKLQLYQVSLLIGFVSHGVLYFTGYQNFMVTYLLIFVSGFSLGLNDVVTYSLMSDVVDDYRHKTGINSEGLSFSFHTFMSKMQSAIGLFFIGIVLAQTGFIENVQQNALTLDGIFSLITIYPAIASLIAMLPMLWFKLPNLHTRFDA
jgi:sugar (glycoside-pentoside-hexuronide) transporter